ncbi:MAG TPA: adenylate/guanylate cyclase domain-containing protein [Dehalococcoidia bacterium]|jgi:class 3 adenylate cyclase
MEQEIRFCKTSDGVRIAYASIGEGYPVVFVHGWASHLEFWPKMPRFEETVFSKLAAHFRFIRYDARGWGLSDRDVTDFSIESKLRDVEAVVENAGLERFAVLGVSEGGPTAITYAVQHPERVSHLILSGTFACRPMPETPEEQQLLNAMLMTIKPGWGKDTPEFRQLWTARFMPEGDLEMIRWFNELQRVSGKAETVMAVIGAMVQIDVRALLPQVQMPTLVTHARGDLAVPFELGREIASMIPNARFLPLESNNHLMLPGEPANDVLAKAITDFIGDPTADAKTKAQATAPSGLVTILFTDMEGSTAMTQQLGDDRAQDRVREHNTAVRDALKAHTGKEIKHTGDGIMASFASARGAVDCAIAIQRALAAGDSVRVRIGLNAGEPVAEEQDLYGTSVQMAARVCAEANGGEILVSDVVRQLVAGKGFLFNDRGDHALKGFEDPVRVYEVSWRGAE